MSIYSCEDYNKHSDTASGTQIKLENIHSDIERSCSSAVAGPSCSPSSHNFSTTEESGVSSSFKRKRNHEDSEYTRHSIKKKTILENSVSDHICSSIVKTENENDREEDDFGIKSRVGHSEIISIDNQSLNTTFKKDIDDGIENISDIETTYSESELPDKDKKKNTKVPIEEKINETEREEEESLFEDLDYPNNPFKKELNRCLLILKKSLMIDMNYLNNTVNPLITSYELFLKGNAEMFSIRAYTIVKKMYDIISELISTVPQETKDLLDVQYPEFDSVDWTNHTIEMGKELASTVLNNLDLVGEYPERVPECSKFTEINRLLGSFALVYSKLKHAFLENDHQLFYFRYSMYNDLLFGNYKEITVVREIMDQCISKMKILLMNCINQMNKNETPTIPRIYVKAVQILSKEENELIDAIIKTKEELSSFLDKVDESGSTLVAYMIQYFFLNLLERNKCGSDLLFKSIFYPNAPCSTQSFWVLLRRENTLINEFISKAATEFKNIFQMDTLDSMNSQELLSGMHSSAHLRHASSLISRIIVLKNLLAQLNDFKLSVKDLVGQYSWDRLDEISSEQIRKDLDDLNSETEDIDYGVINIDPEKITPFIKKFESSFDNFRALYMFNRIHAKLSTIYSRSVALRVHLQKLDFHIGCSIAYYVHFSRLLINNGNFDELRELKKKLYRSLYFSIKAATKLI